MMCNGADTGFDESVSDRQTIIINLRKKLLKPTWRHWKLKFSSLKLLVTDW